MKTIFKFTTNLLKAKYFITEQDLKVSKATLDQPFWIIFNKGSFKTVMKMNINSNMLFSSYKWDDVEKQSFKV
jgi:hypothetical protein